jgi:hypothetical protein
MAHCLSHYNIPLFVSKLVQDFFHLQYQPYEICWITGNIATLRSVCAWKRPARDDQVTLLLHMWQIRLLFQPVLKPKACSLALDKA